MWGGHHSFRRRGRACPGLVTSRTFPARSVCFVPNERERVESEEAARHGTVLQLVYLHTQKHARACTHMYTQARTPTLAMADPLPFP